MLTIGRSRQSKLGSGLAAPHCHLSPGQPSVIFYPSVMPAAAAATVYGSKEAVTDGRGRAPDTRLRCSDVGQLHLTVAACCWAEAAKGAEDPWTSRPQRLRPCASRRPISVIAALTTPAAKGWAVRCRGGANASASQLISTIAETDLAQPRSYAGLYTAQWDRKRHNAATRQIAHVSPNQRPLRGTEDLVLSGAEAMMAGGDVKGRTQTMARSEDRPSDDDGSDSASDRSSDYDSDSSDRSSNEGSENASEDEVESETEEAAAKKERVRADVDEMRRMMADMDAVRARLQMRFTAERQARQDREREEQDAARSRCVEEARARQVEASVQTDVGGDSQMKVHPSQRGSGLQHPVPDAASAAGDRSLSAVDGDAGFADVAPNKVKPAGLSLYDLVKASGFNSSRMTRSPVHPPTALSPTCDKHELAGTKRQEHSHSPAPVVKRDWDGADSQPSNDQDSVLGGHTGRATSASRHHAASVGSARSSFPQSKSERSLRPSHRYDENSPSASNSFASSGADNQAAVLSDLTQQRDYRFNAAALLNASKQDPHSSIDGNSGKTDEQREMEAIQCLLFGGRR